MIKLTIEAASIAEAYEIIDALRLRAREVQARMLQARVKPEPRPAEPQLEAAPDEPKPAADVNVQKRGPGRPKKVEATPATPAPLEAPKAQAPAEVAAPAVATPVGADLFEPAAPVVAPVVAMTPAERHATVLAYYNDAKNGGAAKAMALLQRHGLTRFTELKPEQFAAFDAMLAAAAAGTYDPIAGA